MRIIPNDRRVLVDAAMGRCQCDLIIKNTKLVNVFTKEIYRVNIGIHDGYIAFVDRLENIEFEAITEAQNVIDGSDFFTIPGFIDAHMHIESSMMTVPHFTKAVLPLGTTTIFADPHEVANVSGVEGVKYFIRQSKTLPMRQYFLIPSCVPSISGLENSGAEFGAKEIEELIQYENVNGLGEIMDFIGVINNDERMCSIIKSCEERGGFLQGHIVGANERELCAYLCGGPESCHESEYASEALSKLRLGMYVDARENSMSLNMAEVIRSIKNLSCVPENLTMCTDDIEPTDLVDFGHMNFVVNRAIECGLKPIDAIKCASLNVAREMGMRNLGAIAPGYCADILLVADIEKIQPEIVICKGKVVAEKGTLIVNIEAEPDSIETMNTIKLGEMNVEKFKIKAPIDNGRIKTNVIHYLNIENSYTEISVEDLPVKNGYIDISHDSNLKYVTVINRHGRKDQQGFGIVRNLGIKRGTVASTVAHDSHNLVVVYSTPEEAVLAVNEIIKSHGGIVCVDDQNVLGHLKLPIFGLLSPLECKELIQEINHIKRAHKQLGLTQRRNPLLRVAIIALPVIPEVKITDKGLVSVSKSELIPLFPGLYSKLK